jgi:hypothetical protein
VEDVFNMFVAQSLVEHGVLDSLSFSASAVISSVHEYVSGLSAPTWVAVGGIVLAVLWLWRRPHRL